VVDGTVAERTNAPALKADDLHGSGGSNPPRSAKTERAYQVFCQDFDSGSRTRQSSLAVYSVCEPHLGKELASTLHREASGDDESGAAEADQREISAAASNYSLRDG
jgi:hypothetical protein